MFIPETLRAVGYFFSQQESQILPKLVWYPFRKIECVFSYLRTSTKVLHPSHIDENDLLLAKCLMKIIFKHAQLLSNSPPHVEGFHTKKNNIGNQSICAIASAMKYKDIPFSECSKYFTSNEVLNIIVIKLECVVSYISFIHAL